MPVISLPIFDVSSPNAMDVDRRSPCPAREAASPSAGINDVLGDMFNDQLSPLAAARAPAALSRKRSFTPLFDRDNSTDVDPDDLADDLGPTASPLAAHSRRSSNSLGGVLGQRVLERAHSTTSGLPSSLSGRRRQSHGRRPSLQSAFSFAGHGDAAPVSKKPRDAMALKPIRPAMIASRRTQSVCDLPQTSDALFGAPARDGTLLGLGMPPPQSTLGVRPALADARRFVSQPGTTETADVPAWAAEHASEEADGKALPCHKVTCDGLMRVRPSTLNDVIDGKYDALIASVTVIDCRFDYEYRGGHIRGAINLNTEAAVEQHFLRTAALPSPTKSGELDSNGSTRKHILVFHCEFSAMRAPTLCVTRPSYRLTQPRAKHLRSRDRSLNASVYPRVHYPELYVLEGGYARHFAEFPVRSKSSASLTWSSISASRKPTSP